MDQTAVNKAIEAGAPITCATCRLYHERQGYCGELACGGPGAGRDFPVYDGPIPRIKFSERCLVCGSEEIVGLIVGLPTKFALCLKHKKVYDHVGSAHGKVKHPVTVIELPK